MLYSLHTPPDHERGPQYMAQAWLALERTLAAGHSLRVGWARTAGQNTILWCDLPEVVRADVMAQWLAHYPACQLRRLSVDPTSATSAGPNWTADLYFSPAIFPLRTFRQFEDHLNRQLADPLAAVLVGPGGAGQAAGGWELSVRAAERPLVKRAAWFLKHARNTSLRRGEFSREQLFCWGLSRFFAARTLARAVSGLWPDRRPHPIDAMLDQTAEKLHSSALFAVRLRLFVHGGARSAAQEALRRIGSTLGPLALPHGAVLRPGRVQRQRRPAPPAILTAEELATLWHPTTAAVRAERFAAVASRELEPPPNLPTRRSHPTLPILGRVKFRGRREIFGILESDRRRHLLVLGKTGMGKSALLQNLIVSDIRAGRGVVLLDPHGDLAEAVAACVPTERTNDLILFDAGDQSHPVSFNLLDDRRPEQRALVASGIVSSFQKLWGDSWGPRLEYILRNSVLTLVGQPDATLVSVTRLLTDTAYRRLMVGRCSDPLVRNFWQQEFAHWKPQLQAEATGPVLNKVGAYLSSPLLRAIVGQPRNALPLRRILDEGRVLIVNLSKGRMGEDASALLGMLLVTGVQLAAMSRADLPEADRRDAFMYVDEFQNFATSSFATILSEARKFRLNLTISHQYLEQLDDTLRAAVFGNVGSLLSFQVGGRDTEELARQFGVELTPADLMALPKYTAYLRLLVDGLPTPPFSVETLPPPPPLRNPQRIELLRRLSRQRYGRPAARVNEAIERQFAESRATSPAVVH